jgi:hypothetical protein
VNARIRAAVCCALLPAAAAAQTRPGTRGATYTVTYRSATSVYVSAGRAAGIAVGDRLAVSAAGQTVAELEVAFVAEHSSSCRILKETRAVKVGDRVVHLPGSRPEAAAPATAPTSAPPPAAAPATAPVAVGGAPGWARVSGSAALGWSNFRDGTGSGRNVEERMARYGFSFRELGGRPLELVVRGSNRQALRDGLRATILRPEDRRDRLYEASLAWTAAERPFSARAGRLGASPFTALGYLDGVLGEWRPTATLQVGAFGGRRPDAEDAGTPGGAKYGAVLRLLAPRRAPVAYDFVLSGVAEHAGSETSRTYVGQEGHVRAGRFWLHERVEMDLNRGWRQERTGRAAQLSDAHVRVSWRPSDARAVTASYDRRRNFWTAFTRSLPVALFDDRIHQTVRADVAFTRAGGAGTWFGASLRTRETDGRRAVAAHAGARTTRLWSVIASAEATVYQTLYTRGVMATLRAGRDLPGGHRADLSYTFSGYELDAVGRLRHGHRVRLSGYGQFARQAFARADVEHALGDDLEGTRVLIEAGYRF